MMQRPVSLAAILLLTAVLLFGKFRKTRFFKLLVCLSQLFGEEHNMVIFIQRRINANGRSLLFVNFKHILHRPKLQVFAVNGKCLVVFPFVVPLPFALVFTHNVKVFFYNVKILINSHPV